MANDLRKFHSVTFMSAVRIEGVTGEGGVP